MKLINLATIIMTFAMAYYHYKDKDLKVIACLLVIIIYRMLYKEIKDSE